MTRKILFFLFVAAIELTPSSILCQPGYLDASFGTNGIASLTFPGSDFDMYDMSLQSDGKILCFGKFFVASANGNYPAVLRMNADGSGIDFSFGENGMRIINSEVFLTNISFVITVDPSDAIYVAFSDNSAIHVAKLTPDGSFDSTFNSTGQMTLSDYFAPSDILTQPDGKIVVAASASNGFGIARINGNGTMDANFGTSGIQSHPVYGNETTYALDLQNDGKLVICGTTDNGFGDMIGIIRLTTNGNLDNTFGSGGKVSRIINGFDTPRSIKIDSAGKIVVAGRTLPTGGVFNQKAFVARFTENGVEDTSFGTNGLTEIQLSGNADYFMDMVIQPDGKILATGRHDANSTYPSFLIARLNEDGTPDTGFGSSNNGTATATLPSTDLIAHSIRLDPNGDAIIGGTAGVGWGSDNSIRVAKFLTGLNLSTESISTSLSLQVFPNPAKDILNIETAELLSGSTWIEIYSTSGRILQTTNPETGNQRLEINVSSLKQGLYLGIIRTETGYQKFTFVKTP
jgi:uncharacterized delta-60 repeat protein